MERKGFLNNRWYFIVRENFLKRKRFFCVFVVVMIDMIGFFVVLGRRWEVGRVEFSV